MKSHFQRMSIPKRMWQVALGAIAVFAVVVLDDTTGSNAQAQMPTSGTSSAAGKGRSFAPLATDRIAFVSKRDGQLGTDIYTMDSDGNNVIRLTTGGDEDSLAQPTWSPDRSKIAYIEAGTACNCSYAIYVMNADGSNQHPVYTSKPSEYPAWSPDGTRIAFETLDTYDIYVMNPDGSHVTPLTTDATQSYSPSWSPDSSQIAFANTRRDGDDDTEIYVMNSNGSDQHVIADPTSPQSYFLPAWSPDGLMIAFAVRGGAFTGTDPRHIEGGCSVRIYTMNSDGSGMTPVTSGPCDSYPTWSPDNSKIAYDHNEVNVSAQIYVIDVDGSNDHSISGTSDSDYGPNWQRISPVVLVQNDQGTPVAGAQVYTNTNGPGYPSTFVGTTDMSGTLVLPDPQVNEYVIARSLVYTGTTSKAAHDGWAYHVWLTNIVQEFDGLQSAYMITDTTQMTQTVVMSRTNALIGFNIVASVEYNATPSGLSIIAEGLSGKDRPNGFYLPGATDYLLDVSDGQMFFEKVTIYEDKQHWDDADYQFFAYFPRANANLRDDGRSALTGTCCHIHVQGSGDFGTAWNQQSAYSTLIHEFSHYAIGAYDEYFYQYDGDNANCSLVTEPDFDKRASIMANNRNSSEYCTEDNHNPLTHQGLLRGESVWRTLTNNWDDNLGRWTLQSPLDQGFVNPGPNGYISREVQKPVTTIVPVAEVACPPIRVTTPYFSDTDISLNRQGYSIYEGKSDWAYGAWVYGAEIGVDTIEARIPNHNGSGYFATGHADVTSCNAITITLSIPSSPLAPMQIGQSSSPAEPMPLYWITATANFSQTQIHPLLHFASDPPSPPSLYASQGGTNSQQVALTYDPTVHNYSGDFTFDPARALDFQFEVGITGTQGLQIFPHTFVAAQYHSTGPGGATTGKTSTIPSTEPAHWDIFPPETMVNLSVAPISMPDGTGVMGGEVVTLPAPAPAGLVAVGGPYSIQGENPINGSVQLSLAFESEIYCGAVAGSTKIYRYNGSGWDALTTYLNEDWHLAAAGITRWGIYAVFAHPNPQVVFSDVPSGSTFYEYISWITCHGIASGYSDGTFRPNNNATRGQISKMVALAFQWHQDPPAGGYTFADVLPGSTFYLYIEAAYREGVVSGYPCGGTGEPCDPNQRPYFRPSRNVTRGQLSKIISNASRWSEMPTSRTFEDIPPTHTFYAYIERMASRGIINGYACGGAGEPCGGSNLPYFRPNANATRGQLGKMIYLALQPR